MNKEEFDTRVRELVYAYLHAEGYIDFNVHCGTRLDGSVFHTHETAEDFLDWLLNHESENLSLAEERMAAR